MRFLLLSILLIPFFAYSQEEKVYQLSGVVMDSKTEEPIPYVRIVSKKSKTLIVANKQGFYSIPVTGNDTLYFFALGYKPLTFSVPKYLDEYKGYKNKQYIYSLNYMKEDSIRLPEVTIFPYKTPEELKTAILNVPISPTDPLYVAHKNVDPQIIERISEALPKDVEERQQVALQLYRETFHKQGVMPYYPIADPVLIYKVVRDIVNKTKEAKAEKYMYWED